MRQAVNNVTLRIPVAIVETVKQFAEDHRVSQNQAFVQLLQTGLQSHEIPQRKDS